MNTEWERLAQSLVTDLQGIFGSRLLSLDAYGEALEGAGRAGLNSLALVSTLNTDDLDACARLASGWARRGIDIPLIVPQQEFQRSLDAFPLEYSDILATHARVFGGDPFAGVVIDHEDLRRACEKQAKSHLVHLREGYIESEARPVAVSTLVRQSAPAFAALLRSIARLLNIAASSRVEAAVSGASALGVDGAVVRSVMALLDSSTHTTDGARLYPSYLAAVEQLAHAVDTWRP